MSSATRLQEVWGIDLECDDLDTILKLADTPVYAYLHDRIGNTNCNDMALMQAMDYISSIDFESVDHLRKLKLGDINFSHMFCMNILLKPFVSFEFQRSFSKAISHSLENYKDWHWRV